MGTRADFFVGRGLKAEWIGSVAIDEYPDGIDKKVLMVGTEAKFRDNVRDMLTVGDREDGTTPEMGWPWPWKDPSTSDYTYAFDSDEVWYSRCSSPDGWDKVRNWKQHEKEDDCGDCSDPPPCRTQQKIIMPVMSTKRYARAGETRSGMIMAQMGGHNEG